MKNLVKLVGFTVIVAVIGFSLTGCPEQEPKDALDQTRWEKTIWEGQSNEKKYFLSFHSPDFSYGIVDGAFGTTAGGTYTLSDGDKTVTLEFDRNSVTAEGTISGNKLTLTDLYQEGDREPFTKVK